jgi:SAM-dependent methyltransferase
MSIRSSSRTARLRWTARLAQHPIGALPPSPLPSPPESGERAIGRATAIVGALVVALSLSAAAQDQAPGAPFVPTPLPVVERMLELARVTPADVVYDLGSGDGRVVITAAQRYGARGVGVELNPVWVRDARRFAEQLGVTDKVTFRIEDLFTTDLREATVVTLYLYPAMNRKLAPRLLAELAPGARIVSHEYGIGDWPPDKTEEMIVNGARHVIHIWTVPPPGERQPK